MSSPPEDNDANGQHAGARSVKPSKIPNPVSSRRTTSADRRAPTSVSATGSPRLGLSSGSLRNIMSPVNASKLPRKSQPPGDATAPEIINVGDSTATSRSSLPRARNIPQVTVTPSLAYQQQNSTSPPSDRNKPLPSPPFAQVVDPNSPMKAQRTLIDADSGSPSEDQWPILRPEHVAPLSSNLAMIRPEQQQSRSISEGSAVPSRRYDQYMQMVEPRGASSDDTHGDSSFHAISTVTEVAMESPMTRKMSTPTFPGVPPRTSSKRLSLPSLQDNDALPAIPSRLPPRVSTKRPTFPVTTSETSEHTDEHAKVQTGPGISMSTHDDSDTTFQTLTQTGTPSTSDLAQDTFMQPAAYHQNETATSSMIVEPDEHYQHDVHVRRITWRESDPKSGPLLTKYGDADEIIYGKDRSVEGAPDISEEPLQNVSFASSLNTLTHQSSIPPSSPTALDGTPPSMSTRRISKDITPVRVPPIRGMLPSRTPSTNVSPTTPLTPTMARLSSTQPGRRHSLLMPGIGSSPDPHTSDDTLDPSKMLTDVNMQSSSGTSMENDCKPDRSGVLQYKRSEVPHDQEPMNSPSFELPQKAERILGMREDALPTSRTSPPSWMPSALTSSRRTTEQSGLSSLIQPRGVMRDTDRLSGAEASGSLSPFPPPSAKVHRKVTFADLSQPQVSDFNAPSSTHSATGTSDSRVRDSRASRQSDMGRVDIDKDGDPAPSTKKLKIKRSFRDLFRRRSKSNSDTPRSSESKRSSINFSGSALANRLRSSASFSRLNLSRSPATTQQSQGSTNDNSNSTPSLFQSTEQPATLTALEATTSGSSTDIPLSSTHIDATSASAINTLLTRVAALPSDSPDRLVMVQTAEVCATLEHREAMLNELRLTRKLQFVLRSAELNKASIALLNEMKRLARQVEQNVDRVARECENTRQAIEQSLPRPSRAAMMIMMRHLRMEDH